MKVLVTGFDPFGGEKVNPAYEAVKLLPDTIAGAEIIKIHKKRGSIRGSDSEIPTGRCAGCRTGWRTFLHDSGKSSDQFKRSKDSGQ